jgi:acetyltransferase-like isoleucine patch superfamily enzyme
MLRFLKFIFGPGIYKIHSIIIKFILQLKGLKIGNNFYMEGIPSLKMAGKPSNIIIGNNVSIFGDIDLRNRENGRIIIEDNVKIEHQCRFVAARDGCIRIGAGSAVTAYAIFNGGADITIGSKCVIGPRSSINSSEHLMARNSSIREQGFWHEPILIDEECWLASNVVINKGVKLGKGTVIGAGTVVTKDTEPFGIYGGVPARLLKYRE